MTDKEKRPSKKNSKKENKKHPYKNRRKMKINPIKVSCYCKVGMLSGNPHETFIVKNPKKIEFYKTLIDRGKLNWLKYEEIK